MNNIQKWKAEFDEWNESQTFQAHTRPFMARAKEMHDLCGLSSGQKEAKTWTFILNQTMNCTELKQILSR